TPLDGCDGRRRRPNGQCGREDRSAGNSVWRPPAKHGAGWPPRGGAWCISWHRDRASMIREIVPVGHGRRGRMRGFSRTSIQENQLSVTLSWLILLLGGLFEVGWAIGLKYTEGFTRFWPSVGTLISMAVS